MVLWVWHRQCHSHATISTSHFPFFVGTMPRTNRGRQSHRDCVVEGMVVVPFLSNIVWESRFYRQLWLRPIQCPLSDSMHMHYPPSHDRRHFVYVAYAELHFDSHDVRILGPPMWMCPRTEWMALRNSDATHCTWRSIYVLQLKRIVHEDEVRDWILLLGEFVTLR